MNQYDTMTRCAAWTGADRGSDGGGYVDLSGVIFIRSTSPPKGKPLDPEYDELNLGWKHAVTADTETTKDYSRDSDSS